MTIQEEESSRSPEKPKYIDIIHSDLMSHMFDPYKDTSGGYYGKQGTSKHNETYAAIQMLLKGGNDHAVRRKVTTGQRLKGMMRRTQTLLFAQDIEFSPLSVTQTIDDVASCANTYVSLSGSTRPSKETRVVIPVCLPSGEQVAQYIRQPDHMWKHGAVDFKFTKRHFDPDYELRRYDPNGNAKKTLVELVSLALFYTAKQENVIRRELAYPDKPLTISVYYGTRPLDYMDVDMDATYGLIYPDSAVTNKTVLFTPTIVEDYQMLLSRTLLEIAGYPQESTG